MSDVINPNYRARMWKDTVTNLTTSDPIPALREFVYDENGVKVGNGITAWSSLPYYSTIRSSEIVTTTPVTISAGRKHHTVFVNTDTIGSPATVNLTAGTLAEDSVNVVAIGSYDVTVVESSLNDTVDAGTGREYIWTGTEYLLNGGGGGGGTDFSNIQVPQPETFVEKWNDNGAGNITSKMNEWDTGLFKTTIRRTDGTPDQDITADIWIRDIALNGITPNLAGGPYYFSINYVASSQSFTVSSDIPGSTYGIISISKLEDDPDNLPLLEIPADPGVFKDWYNEYLNYANTAQTINVPVADGRYEVIVQDDATGNHFRSECSVKSAEGGLLSIFAWAASNQGTYTYATGVWDTGNAGYSVVEINRWQNVAGDGAQLNPPVDGWETRLPYDSTRTDTTISNLWGIGEFSFIVSLSGLGAGKIPVKMTLPNLTENFTEWIFSSPDGVGNGLAQLNYDFAANEFRLITAGSTTAVGILEVKQFNSLVNVQHNYIPDPRSVAQKDWVELLPAPQTVVGNILNVWGDGDYKFLVKFGTGTYSYDLTVKRGAMSAGGIARSPVTSSGVDHNVTYAYDTRLFSNSIGGTFESIKKHQDSQASDAPRTVLDDGLETVYEDFSNTNFQITEPVENGTYQVYLGSGSGDDFTSIVEVKNSALTCKGSWSGTGILQYTTANGLWTTGNAAYKIFRIRKQTGKLRIDAQIVTTTTDGNNITNAVIDTDAGDVDVSSYFSDTSIDRVVRLTNGGTSGNHLTGCPGSIEIGDGKMVTFLSLSGWHYNDSVVDEYDDGSSNHIILYAGGLRITFDNTGANPTYDRWKVGP